MAATVTPFLMFEGRAEEAMRFYVSLFDDGEVLDLVHYGREQPGLEGRVQSARFRVGGLEVMCIDSPVKHDFGFTPASSLFIDCESEAQHDRLVRALREEGSFLLSPGDYGFSRRFAWLNDRFGVSWQLNLP